MVYLPIKYTKSDSKSSEKSDIKRRSFLREAPVLCSIFIAGAVVRQAMAYEIKNGKSTGKRWLRNASRSTPTAKIDAEM